MRRYEKTKAKTYPEKITGPASPSSSVGTRRGSFSRWSIPRVGIEPCHCSGHRCGSRSSMMNPAKCKTSPILGRRDLLREGLSDTTRPLPSLTKSGGDRSPPLQHTVAGPPLRARCGREGGRFIASSPTRPLAKRLPAIASSWIREEGGGERRRMASACLATLDGNVDYRHFAEGWSSRESDEDSCGKTQSVRHLGSRF